MIYAGSWARKAKIEAFNQLVPTKHNQHIYGAHCTVCTKPHIVVFDVKEIGVDCLAVATHCEICGTPLRLERIL